MAAKKILMNSMTSCEKEDRRYDGKKCMDSKKILTKSMTSLEKEDMAGKNEWLQEL